MTIIRQGHPDAAHAPAVARSSIIDLLSWAGDGNPAAWEEIMRRYSSSSSRRCAHSDCRTSTLIARCRRVCGHSGQAATSMVPNSGNTKRVIRNFFPEFSSARLPRKQRPLQKNVVNSYQQFITPRRDRCLLTVSQDLTRSSSKNSRLAWKQESSGTAGRVARVADPAPDVARGRALRAAEHDPRSDRLDLRREPAADLYHDQVS